MSVPQALKLLFIVHAFPPPTVGGTALYTRDLAQELRQRGHTVTVLYPESDPSRPEGAVSEDTQDALPIIRVNVCPTDLIGQLKNERVAKVIGDVAQRLEADLVHIHHLGSVAPSVPTALAKYGTPSIMTVHDGWLLCQQNHFLLPDGSFCREGPETVDKCVHCFLGRYPDPTLQSQTPEIFYALALRRQLISQAIENIDTLIVPSRFIHQSLVRHGLDHPRIQNLPLGLRPFPRLPSVPSPGPVRFTFLGAVSPAKGLDLAVRAISLLPPNAARLDIWGRILDAGYFASVMSQVERDQQVVYQGPYTPADLPRIMSHADVGITPSRTENYAFTTQEFLHGGVPVIAADVGGVHEIIRDGENGSLFHSGDYAGLARRMRFFVESPDQVAIFRSRVRPVRTISEDATDLEALYSETLERAVAGRAQHQELTTQPVGVGRGLALKESA